jgi:hypothetical protein
LKCRWGYSKIDGCGELGIFWRIVLPLFKPIVALEVILASNGQIWQGRPESNEPILTKINYEQSNQQANPTQQIIDWLTVFSSALDQGDFAAAAGLFAAESYWRDLVAFTWNIKTAEGQADIEAMLTATVAQTEPGGWRIEGEATTNGELTEAWFTFETAVARGKGHIRLKAGLCRTLLTAMQELKGFEEKKGRKRVAGTQHVVSKNRKNWFELRQQEEAELGYSQQPYCVIIGGGQGGIALAARLRRLAVPTIIIEKNERAGDSWRNRYHSLCLHDQVWQNDLPYLPYPDDWPVFIPKDKMGDWLIAATTPYGLMHISGQQSSQAIQKQDADFYWRLTEAGFLLDFGDDGSGLGMKYMRRGSGYYIDVGASELIIQGEIKLRSRVSVAADSVILTDGSELPADLIVCATGYGSMNSWAGRLISQDVADKVGQCWGLGSKTKYDPGPWEGELRNMWKPTQQPSLWFHGGNLQQSRFYSQYLSLQIKARMEGVSTPVYGMEKVHHR